MFKNRWCMYVDSNSRFVIPVSNYPTMAQFTLELMFKSSQNGGHLLNLSQFGAPNYNTLPTQWTTPTLTIRSNNQLYFRVYSNVFQPIGPILNQDNWYVLTITRNGNTYNVYLDSILIGTYSFGWNATPAGIPYWHTRAFTASGYDCDTNSQTDFVGYIQSFKIFNRVLNSSEIKFSSRRLFDSRNNALWNSLITYIPFQEGSGMTYDIINNRVSQNVGQWVPSNMKLICTQSLVKDDKGMKFLQEQGGPPPRENDTGKTSKQKAHLLRRCA